MRALLPISALSRKTGIFIFLLSAALVCQQANAQQITTTYGTGAQALAETITGNGVQILNPIIVCADSAYGQYSINNISNFPSGTGVVLSTGDISDVRGPNISESTTTQWNTPGDNLLTQITGYPSFDACRLEFDVVPVGDTLRFNFTFASEEYKEYVGTPFNDAFGFFISGPGITGDPGLGNQQNIALIPGTNQAVEINSVNNGNPSISFPAVNSHFYVPNPLGFNNLIQFDGWTQGLVAQSVVNPCDTFHLKLVVADVADREWDSAVFIEAIQSNSVSLSSTTDGGLENMVEGCNPGTVTFTRSPVTPSPLVVTYFIEGSAVNGTDYPLVGGSVNPATPKFITIPANQATASISFNPPSDGIDEDIESIVVYVGNPLCVGTLQDSLTFLIQDSINVAVSPLSAFVCIGDSLTFDVESDGTSFSWSPSTYLNNASLMEPTTIPTEDITYVLSATVAACTSVATTNVLVTDISLSADVTNIICGGANDGAINLNVAGAQNPLTFEWAGPDGFSANTEDLLNVGPGTYIALVTDANGCTASISTQISEIPTLNVTLESAEFNGGDNISCFEGNDGQITAFVTGGVAPYTFAWNDAAVQVTQTATGLSPNTYQVTVTDANGCTRIASINLTAPDMVTGTLLQRTDVLCAGENTGNATVQAVGGHSPYTYIWNTVPPQSGPTATNLTGGVYTVHILDANGCLGNVEVEIGQPDSELAGSINTTNPLCSGDATGAAMVSVSGGTPPYNYLWSSNPLLNTPQIGDLPSGAYAVTVIDGNGCELTFPFNITAPAAIDITILALQNVSCADGNSGYVTVLATGGTSPYTYAWNTSPVSNSPELTGLSAGTYIVDATDANGCMQSLSVNISQPQTLAIELSESVMPLCSTSEDGSLEVNATGGTAPYSYQWNTVPLNFSNLLENIGTGSYEVMVTDANGCTVNQVFTLSGPTAINITATNMQMVLCNGASTGAATVSVVGGTSPYTYAWNDLSNQTTATASGLTAGAYIVTVTDQNGCLATLEIVISEPEFPLMAEIGASIDVNCFGENTGAATATATGGSGSYSYQWSDASGQQTPTATGLSAGTYSVTIFDNNGCDVPVILEVTIDGPAEALAIELTPSVFAGGSNIACAGDSSATIDLAITGGTAPYTILWNLPGLDTSTDQNLSDLGPGIYSVTVTDDNSCEATASVSIVNPQPISIEYATTPSLCFGIPAGTIELQILGGMANYVVEWSGPNGFISDLLSLATLEGGIYNLTITDANGCQYIDAITVTQPDDLIITVDSLSDFGGFNTSCYNSFDGEIHITPTGGLEPYSYQWNKPGIPNFSNQQDVINLNAGNYEAVLIDANGCVQNQFIALTAPDTLQIVLDASSYNGGFNISCNGEDDGTIEAMASGGTPGYNFVWIGSTGFGPVAGNPIENLDAGEYSVLVQDANGCSNTETALLTQPDTFSIDLLANLINGSNISCNGGNDGAINLSIVGGSVPLSISWTGPNGFISNVEDLFGLAAGEYCATVVDALGCTQTQCITLSEPEPLAIILSPVLYVNGLNLNCDDSNDGGIAAAVTGGTPSLVYAWTGPENFTSASLNLAGIQEGEYCLTATDLNGCNTTACTTLLAPEPIEIIIDANNAVECSGSATGSLEVSIMGGDPAFTYSWTGPNGFAAVTEDISGLEPGAYCLLATDANNCTAERCFNVIAPPALMLAIAPSTFAGGFEISCNGAANATASALVSGGVAPFTYAWTGPDGFTASTSFIENLDPGNYCIEITDANNCNINDCVLIDEPAVLSTNTLITTPDCSDGGPATVDLNVSGGVAPYTFNWSSGDNMETLQLDEGIYNVIVTDANGCTASDAINISLPASIVVIPTASLPGGGFNITCNDNNDASISLTVFGGSGDLSALWTGPNGFSSTDPDISDLEIGEYCITVTDDLGCTGDSCIIISEPLPLAITFTSNAISCLGNDDGSISAMVSGGVPTYSINWTGPDGYTGMGSQISGLEAGTYCAEVEDFNGCTFQQCFDLVDPALLIVSLSSPETNGFNIACFGGNNGSIEAVVNGGDGNYNFSWTGSGGFLSSDEDLFSLFVGQYCLTVTDGNGCTAQSCITLTQAPGIDVTIDAFEYANGFNTSCSGVCDASLSTTLNGGAAPITINWDGPGGFDAGTPDLSDLCAGAYSINTTDANGCEQGTSILITEPVPVQVILESPTFGGGTEISCFGENTGTIYTTILGGLGDLTIDWTGPNGYTSSNDTIGNLGVGTYVISVSDANGCSDEQNITLTQPAVALEAVNTASVFPSGDNISCFGGNNGEINSSVTGGTAPYQYYWDGPSNYTSTLPAPINLEAGEYTLVIEDANSCVFTVMTTLTEPSDTLTAPYVVMNEIDCANDMSGALSVTPLGGSIGYGISWSGPDDFASNAFDLTELDAGNYTYVVEDINGCTFGDGYEFINPLPILITAEVINASCQSPDGIIDISIENGNAPFSYSWSNGSSDEDLVGLAAGTYSVEVMDSSGCSASDTIEIMSTNTLSVDVRTTDLICNSDPTGVAIVQTTDGDEPYTISWSGPDGFTSSNDSLEGLFAGAYLLSVTDANGCFFEETYGISEPQALEIEELTSQVFSNGFDLSGFETADGVINSPVVTGGTTPYTFMWISDNGYNSTSGSNQLNLAAGRYQLTVTDANMCTDTASITLRELVPLEIPNGISPNGDGFNDFFEVRGLEDYPRNRLLVFNRWGSQVFDETNYRNITPWYGTNQDGDELPEGTYFVVVELEGHDNLQGYLEIRR